MIGYLVVDTSYCSDELIVGSIHNMRTFGFFRSIAFDGSTLYLFKNSHSNNYIYEDDQFLLVATGTFIYNDCRGNGALKNLALVLRRDADITAEYRHFHGPYTLLALEKAGTRLRVITDREGLQHCFVSERNGAKACSSSQLLLAAVGNSALNSEAIREFIHLGRCLHGKTLFKNIERLQPATILTKTNNAWRSRRLWKINVLTPCLPDTHQQIVDKTAAMLENATRIANTVEPGRLIADLTGGADSRLVVSFLLRVQPQLTVSAAGAEDHIDIVRSREIAATLGLNHFWNEQKSYPELTEDKLDEVIELADGSMNPLNLLQKMEYFENKIRKCEMSFGGNGGPLLKDHYWLFEFNRTGLQREPNWQRVANLNSVNYIVQDNLFVGFERGILEDVASMLLNHSKVVPGSNNQKLDYVYFDFKSPDVSGAQLSLSNKFHDVYHPLLEGELVEYMINVDPSVRKYNFLQFALIYRNDRRLAWILTDTGIPAVPPVGKFVPLKALVFRRYARSGLRKFNNFVLKRRDRTAPRSVDPVAEDLWARGYLDFLDYEKLSVARIISRERLSALRDNPKEGSNQVYLLNILAVELFVKRVEELSGRRIGRL